MFDFGNGFADEFQKVIDQFSGKCPEAKACADRKELAAWFERFARACRAALPKAKSAEAG